MIHRDEFDSVTSLVCPKGKYIDFENRVEDFTKLNCEEVLENRATLTPERLVSSVWEMN
jgi:hypothetical protein